VPDPTAAHTEAEPSDQELLDRARAGVEDAAAELFRRWAPWCARLAMRLCGDAADAEEVAQDSLVHLLSRPERIVLAGRLGSLLYPIVRFRALTAVRSRRSLARLERGGALRRPERPGPAPDERAMEDERLRALHDAVGRLPGGQREVLLMRLVHGMTVAEVAHALRIPEGTVKSRLSAAISSLKDPES